MIKTRFILLVLICKEIILGPDLSSQPRFRIQGGTLSVTEDAEGGGEDQNYLCLILNCFFYEEQFS